MKHVLVVANDRKVFAALTPGVGPLELVVETAPGSRAAQSYLHAHQTDLVVIDADLQGVDAVELATSLRQEGFLGGVIILAAANTEMDRVLGLDAGADDYIPKPPRPAELHARMNAVLRRVHTAYNWPSRTPGLTVNATLPLAMFAGTEVILGGHEYPLLTALLQHVGYTVTYEELARRAWPNEQYVPVGTVSMATGRLRAKLKDTNVPYQIDSVRGRGYRLRSVPTQLGHQVSRP